MAFWFYRVRTEMFVHCSFKFNPAPVNTVHANTNKNLPLCGFKMFNVITFNSRVFFIFFCKV